MQTSSQLIIGQTYSREDLSQKFGTRTRPYSGIFRPKGHDSIWLFVTQDKTADRTRYKDELMGEDLYIEGQKSGRKDKLLAEHFESELEVLPASCLHLRRLVPLCGSCSRSNDTLPFPKSQVGPWMARVPARPRDEPSRPGRR
jgi:hypothetical protein